VLDDLLFEFVAGVVGAEVDAHARDPCTAERI
jgi:hypothetical protein